jgi:hypothetical protein
MVEVFAVGEQIKDEDFHCGIDIFDQRLWSAPRAAVKRGQAVEIGRDVGKDEE